MACRVRVRLKRGGKNIETSAILNSGFGTDSPDIIIPVEIAKKNLVYGLLKKRMLCY